MRVFAFFGEKKKVFVEGGREKKEDDERKTGALSAASNRIASFPSFVSRRPPTPIQHGQVHIAMCHLDQRRSKKNTGAGDGGPCGSTPTTLTKRKAAADFCKENGCLFSLPPSLPLSRLPRSFPPSARQPLSELAAGDSRRRATTKEEKTHLGRPRRGL